MANEWQGGMSGDGGGAAGALEIEI